MGPRAATAATARAIELSSLTSQTKPSPAAEVPLRVSPATLCPAPASSNAIAAPMPRLAPVTSTAPSGIDEPRLALLRKGRGAFLGVLGLEGERGKIGLHLQTFVDRQIEGPLHRRTREAQHGQAVAGELAREGETRVDG